MTAPPPARRTPPPSTRQLAPMIWLAVFPTLTALNQSARRLAGHADRGPADVRAGDGRRPDRRLRRHAAPAPGARPAAPAGEPPVRPAAQMSTSGHGRRALRAPNVGTPTRRDVAAGPASRRSSPPPACRGGCAAVATAKGALPDLLQSKLHLPPPRRTVLDRSRLLDRLGRARRGRPDARVGAGRVRQDDAADRVARRPRRRPATAWLSLDARDNDPVVVLDLRRRRAADRGARAGRERAGAAAASHAGPTTPASSAAQRPRTPLDARPGARARRLPRHRVAREVHEGAGVPARAPAAAACTWCSPPAPTRRCRWRGCGPAVSWSRSAPPTCASPPRRPRRTSTTRWGWR